MVAVKHTFRPSFQRHNYLRLKKLYQVSLLDKGEAYGIYLDLWSFLAIIPPIKLFIIDTIFSRQDIIVIYSIQDLKILEELQDL